MLEHKSITVVFCIVDTSKKTSGDHEHTGFMSRLKKSIHVRGTPGTDSVPDSEEEEYQGAIFQQKKIEGPAIQTLACIVMTLFPACLGNEHFASFVGL
jgi:hypothetical protein